MMDMNVRSKGKGFTIIEILVVLAVIGILAAILYAKFGDARVDAKNKAMRSEMKETQLAIELYKAQFGQYPPAQDLGVANCATTVFGIATAKSSVCNENPVINGIVPEFIAGLPDRKKSANSSCDIVYVTDSVNNSWYKLVAENCHGGATAPAEGVQQDDEFARCPSTCPSVGNCIPTSASFYQSYAIYSDGGECKY